MTKSLPNKLNIAVIGGGAAGFFAALSAKKHHPNSHVTILEKSSNVLSKVKISGGGRCNVTHACSDNRELARFYPRGEHSLKKAFEQFNAQNTIQWFESRGVTLKTYPDNCIFPQSNESQTIINCFLAEAAAEGISIQLNQSVQQLELTENSCIIHTRETTHTFHKVIIATGGQPKRSGLTWLEKLGYQLIDPVPSLFTFNMPNHPISELMGNVVEQTSVKVEGTKLIGKGPLLITHWGMSGPAILQLSAWGARILAEKNYHFTLLVNWLNEEKENTLRHTLETIMKQHPEKMINNFHSFPMTNRLWNFLLLKSGIHPEMRWKELGKKASNKLINTLLNDRYEVSGKTTFKEEFVTAGGIALTNIDTKTMKSKLHNNLFFAGELLDIDGITGGFNFQAAWTTGFIAGKSVGIT